MTATRTLSPVAEHAQQIRAAYKAAGIKARVTSSNFSMGCSISVRVLSGSVKRAEEIANRHASISRCEITGEILSGSNRYVDVSADDSLIAAHRKITDPMVAKAFAALMTCGDQSIIPIGMTGYGLSWDAAMRHGSIWGDSHVQRFSDVCGDALQGAQCAFAGVVANDGGIRREYTAKQLQQFVIDDLLVDAVQAEERAAKGGPDAAEQAAYGAKCRADIATLKAENRPKLDQYGWPVALK